MIAFDNQNSQSQYYFFSRIWNRCLTSFGKDGIPDYEFHHGNQEVNLMGIRGLASWGGNGRPSWRVMHFDKTGVWDDTLQILFQENASLRVEHYPVSLQYGYRQKQLEDSRDLRPGFHRYMFGYHGTSHYTQKQPLSVLSGSQWTNAPSAVGKRYYRALKPSAKPMDPAESYKDLNRNGRFDSGDAIRNSKGVEYTEMGHNIHSGTMIENTTGSTGGEGCQVIHPWGNFLEFMRRMESDHSLKGTENNELPEIPNGSTLNQPEVDGTRPIVYTLIDTNFLFPCCLPLGVSPEERQLSFTSNQVASERLNTLMRQVEMGTLGGYFPLGKNNCWHGGLHLPSNIGATMYAPMPGEIVAFRLGAGEGHTCVSAKYRNYFGAEETTELGSHNFILIRHKLKDGAAALVLGESFFRSDGSPRSDLEREFYSLYMHLGELSDMSNAAIRDSAFLWLNDGYEVLAEAQTITKKVTIVKKDAKGKKTSKEVSVTETTYESETKSYKETAAPLESGSRPGRGMINKSKQNLVLLEKGDRFRVIKDSFLIQDKQPWMLIEKYYDGVSGKPANESVRLYALESLLNPQLSKPLETGKNTDMLDRMRRGDILLTREEFGHTVEVAAGDPLWVTGWGLTPSGYPGGFLHFSIFSAKKLFPKWEEIKDESDDTIVEDSNLLSKVPQEIGHEGLPLNEREIQGFYQTQISASAMASKMNSGITEDDLLKEVIALRKRAVKHQSEWAVDTNQHIPKLKAILEKQGEVFDEAQYRACAKPFLWWREIATKVGLPVDGKVWHYNPLRFLWEVALISEPLTPLPAIPGQTTGAGSFAAPNQLQPSNTTSQ